jgi:hypothetical protein
VADLAGYPVAGLPFLRPETVTTDHGAVYKNHHLIEVQRVIGANILPSRVLRPTDKHAVERTFGGIQSLLFQTLPGYRGVDVADRGTDPAADSGLDLAEMENLIAKWIVGYWQHRKFGEYAPGWDPGGDHSPNTLFAASMAQGGFAVEIPKPELFYELLPAHHVMIHGRRGVKIRGLWYSGDVLDDERFRQPSNRGGAKKRTWVVHSDRRDARCVFFQDPGDGRWHELRWTGLPSKGDVPSFNDARAKDLLRQARDAGLRPRTDAELLPFLLRLLGGHVPVDDWPTQLSASERKDHAREAAQHAAARADRPKQRQPVPDEAEVVALHHRDRAREACRALDEERRSRRERAVPQRPTPPARLGESFRRRSLLSLVRDNDPADDGAAETAPR